MSTHITAIAAPILLSAFAAVTAPPDGSPSGRRADAARSAAAVAVPAGCDFSRGTTTCTSTTTTTEVVTHGEISGCRYGPTGLPGRRTRTFEQTFLVTTTTVVSRHGMAGRVYDTSTTSTRQLVSSRQLSDVCELL